MVSSGGYAPSGFPSLRHKLLLLCRLLPLAQSNVNLVELGPRSTGKSHLLRNLSPRVYLCSGGRMSPAAFFYDLSRKGLGLIGTRKAVVLDEISATMVPDQSFVAALLDYMETGHITWAGRQMTSDCSLVMTGNVELASDGQRPSEDYPHLFSVFPPEMVKSALVDRIHGFIPGWELPKISDQLLCDDLGLLSDYFGEVLTELRRDPTFTDLVRERLSSLRAAPTTLTLRDQRAIERMATGLVRFLFPDQRIDEDGFLEVVQVAIELRQRVHFQRCRMSPGEFKAKTISWGDLPAPTLPEEGRLDNEALDARMNDRDNIGQMTLLYVASGGGGTGDRGFVQCARASSGRRLSITGIRGKVLDESIRAAHDALCAIGHRVGLSAQRLREMNLALHLVDIAVNRDGPSAGLAFALALYSAATDRPLRRGLAVTGELSLAGDVRRVGGIAEKLHAAERRGRSVVLIPGANAPDLAQIREVQSRLQIHPVATFEEAVQFAMA
jgi:ATP-dependent Lon protease